jgi:hypothetical protein
MVILHFCEPIPLIGVATFDGVWGFFSQDFHHVLTKKKKNWPFTSCDLIK